MIEYLDESNHIGLASTCAREANIILNKETNEDRRNFFIEEYRDLQKICQAIDNTNPECQEELDFYERNLVKLFKTGLLSPLTLTEDEFDEHKVNKRYSPIRIVDDSRIINSNAYNIVIDNVYDWKTKTLLKDYNLPGDVNDRIYLFRNGHITGEYIHECQIPDNVIERHCFAVQSVVKINCNLLITDDKHIPFCGVINPKLDALRQFYWCKVELDNEVFKAKYDISKIKV